MIFGFALTNEVKNSKIVIVDHAKDMASQQMITKIEASNYFEIEQISYGTEKKLKKHFKTGKIKAGVVFPENFNHDLLHRNKAQIQVIADASDPNTATTLPIILAPSYQIIRTALNENSSQPYRILTETRMLYNPQLKGAHNFVPGVMALVLMLVCVMMTAISIVKEKETGTMEILLVSPFKPIIGDYCPKPFLTWCFLW